MNSEQKARLGCAVILATPFLVVIASVLNGLALQQLWAWFVSPLGVPRLGLVGAIGIATTVTFLTHQETKSEEKREVGDLVVALLAGMLARPAVTVGWGWLIQWAAR